MAGETVVLRFRTDATGAIRGIEAVGSASGRTAEKIRLDNEAIRSSTHKTTGEFGSMEKGAGRLRGSVALVAGALGFGALTVGLKDVVQAGVKWQEQQAQLQSAMKATNTLTKANSRALDEHAAALSTRGGFGEPANIQALTRLLTVTGSVTKANRDLGLATDAARRFHLPFLSTVRAISMAEAGRTTGLTRLGIAVKKGMTGQEALAALQGKVAGATTAYSKTAAGALSNATNAVDNAGRQISVALLPYIAKLATWFAQNLPKAIKTTIAAVKDVIAWFKQHKDIAIALGVAIGVLITALVGLRILRGITALWVAFDAAMTANPIGLVVVAVAAVAGGLVLLYERSRTFRDVLRTVGHVAATIFNGIRKEVDHIWHRIQAIIGAAQDVANALNVGPLGGGTTTTGHGTAAQHRTVLQKLHQAAGFAGAPAAPKQSLPGHAGRNFLRKEAVQTIGSQRNNSIVQPGSAAGMGSGAGFGVIQLNHKTMLGTRVIAEDTTHYALKQNALSGAFAGS